MHLESAHMWLPRHPRPRRPSSRVCGPSLSGKRLSYLASFHLGDEPLLTKSKINENDKNNIMRQNSYLFFISFPPPHLHPSIASHSAFPFSTLPFIQHTIFHPLHTSTLSRTHMHTCATPPPCPRKPQLYQGTWLQRKDRVCEHPAPNTPTLAPVSITTTPPSAGTSVSVEESDFPTSCDESESPKPANRRRSTPQTMEEIKGSLRQVLVQLEQLYRRVARRQP